MSQTFTFGFESDDIQDADEDSALDTATAILQGVTNQLPPSPLDLDSMLLTLPSHISFSTVELQGADAIKSSVPRRELFDIRAQLMAEDEGNGEIPVAGLLSDDIVPNVYEGGFKTWECSIDLANFLSFHKFVFENDQNRGLTVVELGCGTAIPSLSIFRRYLATNEALKGRAKSLRLYLADYNRQVLELATMPNALLSAYHESSTSRSHLPTSERSTLSSGDHTDLEITPSVLREFKEILSSKNVSISAISGSWTPSFPTLVPFASNDRLLILASETIYSPDSIQNFTRVVLDLLRSWSGGSTDSQDHNLQPRALIAAKKVYFGVGGGIDEFLRVLTRMGGDGRVVWETEEKAGVGRAILEVIITRPGSN